MFTFDCLFTLDSLHEFFVTLELNVASEEMFVNTEADPGLLDKKVMDVTALPWFIWKDIFSLLDHQSFVNLYCSSSYFAEVIGTESDVWKTRFSDAIGPEECEKVENCCSSEQDSPKRVNWKQLLILSQAPLNILPQDGIKAKDMSKKAWSEVLKYCLVLSLSVRPSSRQFYRLPVPDKPICELSLAGLIFHGTEIGRVIVYRRTIVDCKREIELDKIIEVDVWDAPVKRFALLHNESALQVFCLSSRRISQLTFDLK